MPSDFVRVGCVLLRVVTNVTGRNYELARYRAVISRRRNGELCRLGEMGNLATLLVKFGAAFLLACHADYSLAQDDASGKRREGSHFHVSRDNAARRGAHVGHRRCVYTQPDVC